MSSDSLENKPSCPELDPSPLGGEVVEFSLLLPGWQAAALEATAHNCGLTAGQMVRHLIQDYFGKFAHPRPA
jgi:hypothetical protein